MTIPIYSGDVPYPKKDCVLQALRRTWASSTWPTSAFLPPSVPSQPALELQVEPLFAQSEILRLR